MLTLTGIAPELADCQLMDAIQAQRSGIMGQQLVRRLRRAGAQAAADRHAPFVAEHFRNARQLFQSWRRSAINAHYSANVY